MLAGIGFGSLGGPLAQALEVGGVVGRRRRVQGRSEEDADASPETCAAGITIPKRDFPPILNWTRSYRNAIGLRSGWSAWKSPKVAVIWNTWEIMGGTTESTILIWLARGFSMPTLMWVRPSSRKK